MFQSASVLYDQLYCDVGAGSRTKPCDIFGTGCLLTEHHVITARHVWTNRVKKYRWPVISKFDGIFRCETVFESEEADVLILKTTEIIARANCPVPVKFPKIHQKLPRLGMSVGFFVKIQIPDVIGEPELIKSFSQASISMELTYDFPEHPMFVLSAGIIQKGISGGPVFTTKGDLVGVIVQSMQFVPDESFPVIVTLPVIAALYPFRDVIAEIQESTKTSYQRDKPRKQTAQ